MIEVYKVYKDTSKHHRGALWEVSNLGNVKKNGIPYELNTKGIYIYICSKLLHRIIAELFIPNPDNKKYVDHIDGNTHNNRVDNLRWVTAEENMANPITKRHQKESFAKSEIHKNNIKSLGKRNKNGELNPMFNKHHSEYSRYLQSIHHAGGRT